MDVHSLFCELHPHLSYGYLSVQFLPHCCIQKLTKDTFRICRLSGVVLNPTCVVPKTIGTHKEDTSIVDFDASVRAFQDFCPKIRRSTTGLTFSQSCKRLWMKPKSSQKKLMLFATRKVRVDFSCDSASHETVRFQCFGPEAQRDLRSLVVCVSTSTVSVSSKVEL